LRLEASFSRKSPVRDRAAVRRQQIAVAVLRLTWQEETVDKAYIDEVIADRPVREH